MSKYLFILILFLLPEAVSAQGNNVLSGRYSVEELQRLLIPQAQWTPFPRLDDRTGWAKADAAMMQAFVEKAESFADYQWPTIPATLSLLYVRTGNRSQYEAVSFGKREVLGTLLIAEIAENKGRFIDPIINGIWSICEESWWGVPAHLPGDRDHAGLMDVSEPFVDLFAAETGTYLAWADYFLGDRLDAVSPQIRKRIYSEVNYRLMQPLMTRSHWWMSKSAGGRNPNNWNPWICSNWLNFVLLLEKDNARRAGTVGRILSVLDEYLNPFPQDGGCDEGPSYWGAAAASLYDNLSMLNLATGQAFQYVYDDEKVRNMGRFIYRAQISRDYFLNFADADPNAGVDAGMVYRYGKDIRDRDMTDFGAFYRRPSGEKPGGGFMFFRKLFALFMQDELRQATQRLPLLKEVWLPDLEVMVARDAGGSTDGFYLAAKGGHNAESHNHNDVGSYVVFYDGLPLLIDVGRGTYTARTFSSRRYEIWYNNSDYHNLPSINGQTQITGRDGKASGVSYKPGKPFAEFSLDLAKAYPEKTGVNSWKRTVRLNRGKGVQVKDVTDLREAVSVTQHLMTCYPAEVARPGEVVIHYGTKEGQTLDFMVKYDPGQMRAAVEKVRLETEEDEGIRAKWGDVIHRINFDVLSPKKKDTYVFEIRRKP